MDKIVLVQKRKEFFLTKIDQHNEIITILAIERSTILLDHVNNDKSTIAKGTLSRKLRSL